MGSTCMESINNGKWGYLITVIGFEVGRLFMNPSRPSKNSSSRSVWTSRMESSTWSDERGTVGKGDEGRIGSTKSKEIEGKQGIEMDCEGKEEQESETDL